MEMSINRGMLDIECSSKEIAEKLVELFNTMKAPTDSCVKFAHVGYYAVVFDAAPCTIVAFLNKLDFVWRAVKGEW